jgi:hypothetical protein
MAQQEYLPTRILHDFVRRIESLGMKYMLTGAMAMMLYGMYRQTAYIDIVIEFDGCDLTLFQRAFEPDLLCSRQVDERCSFSKAGIQRH